MKNYAEYLKRLRPWEHILFHEKGGDEFFVTRSDERPNIREIDRPGSTILDFVNGYIEDKQYKSMDDLYSKLDNYDLVCMISATGRDMTAEVRLYLAARDYLERLRKNPKIPPSGVKNQERITKEYRDNLRKFGNAVAMMTRENIYRANIDAYGTAPDFLRAAVSRMNAAARGECYEIRRFPAQDVAEQRRRGVKNIEQTGPTLVCAGYDDVVHNLNKLGYKDARVVAVDGQDKEKIERDAAIEEELYQRSLPKPPVLHFYPEEGRWR